MLASVQGLKTRLVVESPGRASAKGPEMLTIGVCYVRPKTHVTVRYNLDAVMGYPVGMHTGPKVPRPRPVHVPISSLPKSLDNVGLLQECLFGSRLS